jgi:uncharacterized membrane protein (DUF2068 family)
MFFKVPGTLRTIALIEATKGILVLAVGCGLITFMHKDIRQFTEQLISHLYLNPAKGYPQVFTDLAGQLTDTHLWILAGAAVIYSLARFIESYGLWFAKRWAEWFAALSGGIYIPFEIHEMIRHASLLTLGALLLNVLIVMIMISELLRVKPG